MGKVPPIEQGNNDLEKRVVDRELEILEGREKPKNILQVQILLAEELFLQVFKDSPLNLKERNDRNKIMEYWGSSGYSEKFRNLTREEDFKNHPRLKGDPVNIKLD